MKRITLRNRRHEIVARALVDDEDAERIRRNPWHLLKDSYAARLNDKGQKILMHREVLGLVPGDGKEVDHINRKPLDNRRSNLRIVSHEANCHNKARPVRYYWFDDLTGQWRAQARRVSLGSFGTEDEARAAVEAWRKTGTKVPSRRTRPFTGVSMVKGSGRWRAFGPAQDGARWESGRTFKTEAEALSAVTAARERGWT